jgi:CsoR family transcriptional regulator, copper-sensing transcriptional repressor
MKKNHQEKVLRRLSIIEGQVRGLQEMIKKDKYCIDVITQSSAVKEALTGVENLILENHLSEHVVHQMRGDKANKAVKEIIKVYKLAHKK